MFRTQVVQVNSVIVDDEISKASEQSERDCLDHDNGHPEWMLYRDTWVLSNPMDVRNVFSTATKNTSS